MGGCNVGLVFLLTAGLSEAGFISCYRPNTLWNLIFSSNKCIKIRPNQCLFTGHFQCTDMSFFTDDYSTISTIQQFLVLVAMNTTAVQLPMVSILTCHLGIRRLAVNQSLKPHPKRSTLSSMDAWVSSGTLVGLTAFQVPCWEIRAHPLSL